MIAGGECCQLKEGKVDIKIVWASMWLEDRA